MHDLSHNCEPFQPCRCHWSRPKQKRSCQMHQEEGRGWTDTDGWREFYIALDVGHAYRTIGVSARTELRLLSEVFQLSYTHLNVRHAID